MKNFKQDYEQRIVPELAKKFFGDNPMRVPRIEKIIINMSAGDAVTDNKVIGRVTDQLRRLSGQNPMITKARKSLAIFKLREGMPVGCKVTLRKKIMYSFLEKLILIVLPSSKDFRGFSFSNFDGNGNLNFGLTSQTLFPETDYDTVDKVRGMNITIVTSTSSDAEARMLFQEFYFPFKNLGIEHG